MPIDRDNFNDVMKRATPRLAMKVDNKLTGEDDRSWRSSCNFNHIDDFEPARVAEQVPALKELLDMRQRLTQLMSKMEGNDKLEGLLAQIMNNTDKSAELAKQVGLEAGGEAPKPEETK